MSKRTIGLIAVLIVVTGVLLAIAVSPQKQTQPKLTPIVATPTPAMQSILMLSPNPLIVSSSSAKVDVNIDTKENLATAVQLEFAFDPKLITNIEITPSTFFENPVVLIKNIDMENGKISYAVGISPVGVAKKGIGTVATITFDLNMKPGEKTEITPLPKTMITAKDVPSSVLKQASGTTITFQ